MELIKVGKSELPYLRIGDLVEGVCYEKIALVTTAGAGLAKNSSGFAKFYLKDVNANVITAFLFDVKDFAFAGMKLSQFKGKPVLVKFTPQFFAGHVSLVIDGVQGIKEWDGEFDRRSFVGSVDFDEGLINEFVKQCSDDGWVLPIEYKLLSTDTFASGKVGAFAKCLEILAVNLKSYQTVLGEEKGLFGKLFRIAAETAYLCEKAKNDTEILADTRVFDIILRMVNKYREDPYYSLVLDVVKAVSGQDQPKHLLSHVIMKSFKQAVEILNLVSLNNSLTIGASVETGGALLLKY